MGNEIVTSLEVKIFYSIWQERLAAEKADWESTDLTSDEKSDEADDLKERKKHKIRKKKKRPAEGQAELRHWPSVKLSKKQHRILPRQISDVEIEKDRDDGQEDAIELPESAVSPPAIAPENIVPSSMGPRLDETTKTARCMTSLVGSTFYWGGVGVGGSRGIKSRILSLVHVTACKEDGLLWMHARNWPNVGA